MPPVPTDILVAALKVTFPGVPLAAKVVPAAPGMVVIAAPVVIDPVVLVMETAPPEPEDKPAIVPIGVPPVVFIPKLVMFPPAEIVTEPPLPPLLLATPALPPVAEIAPPTVAVIVVPAVMEIFPPAPPAPAGAVVPPVPPFAFKVPAATGKETEPVAFSVILPALPPAAFTAPAARLDVVTADDIAIFPPAVNDTFVPGLPPAAVVRFNALVALTVTLPEATMLYVNAVLLVVAAVMATLCVTSPVPVHPVQAVTIVTFPAGFVPSPVNNLL